MKNYTHTYTNVLHGLKNHFQLTDNEYYVISVIEILSRNGSWCYKSKSHIARDLFISLRTVRSSVRKLHQLGLIQNKEGNLQFLRPTTLWLKAKEEFQEKIGHKELSEKGIEEIHDSRSGENEPITVQSFPEKRKKLHSRIIEEENEEKTRLLNQYLNF